MYGKGFTHIFHLRFDAPPPMLSDQVCVPQVANPSVRPSLGPSHRFWGGPSAKLYAAINKGGHFIWVGGSFPPLFSSCADNRSGRRREGREFRTGKEGVGRLSPFFLSAYVAGPPPLRLPCYQIGSVAMASPPLRTALDWVLPRTHTVRTRVAAAPVVGFFSSAAKLSGGGGGGGGGGAYRPARPPDFAPRSTLRPGMRRRRQWGFGERGEGECPTASNCPSVHTISVFV